MKKLILLTSFLLLSLSTFAQQYEVSSDDSTTTSQPTRAQVKFFGGIPYRVQKTKSPRRLGFYDEFTAAINGAVTSVNSKTGTVSLTSTDIPENVNLYYTQARARSAISSSGPIVYNQSTGAFTFSGAPSDVQLGNVNNTSDAAKPVSTAQQTALNLKADVTVVVPYSSVSTYAGLSGVSAPASGFLKFVMVSTDAQYSDSNTIYMITSAGKIRKLALLPSEN